ncbi:MAG: MBL fold metallo-hydrolase [Thermoproteota archaeon]|nr:MBL fold metallo-hydrolase [Thermoproteota archaeon]
MSKNTIAVPDSRIDTENMSQLVVRINGTLPDLSIMGDEEKSERAAEVKRMEIAANTSCSVFTINPSDGAKNEMFHLLIDVGEGVVTSLEKGMVDIASRLPIVKLSDIPNALLITHSHDDHIKELPILLNKLSGSDKLNIYCTKECQDQIMNKFPQIVGSRSGASFNVIQPEEPFEIGPLSIIPVLASHGKSSPPGSVIYIIRIQDRKIICGWDFLSLPNADEFAMWNPDLLILGTQSYNPHPEETGMICVTDAYELVRRWNAKECYLVHYRGLMDFEEGKNQWFRGPVKPMTTAELQKNVDSHLGISGDSGRFKITVAKEGMIWAPRESPKYSYNENVPIGSVIEIEGLQEYVCKIEKLNKEDKLKISIEDRINRYNMQFDRPRRDKNNDQLIHAAGEKGMLAKGPELAIELVTPPSQEKEPTALKIRALKGKKHVFDDDILINDIDALRLKKYFQENFA